MREILFRAKHIHATKKNEHLKGRWIYGYLSDENHINSPELEGEFLIDPDTICQYTGLTDKNGKKIWENDIVECGMKLRVQWHTFKASWALSKKGWMYNHFFGEAVEPEDVEIVGNVFDNPELLN